MDLTLIEDNEPKSYEACKPNEKLAKSQKNEKLDSSFKGWCTCAVSANINMVLYGIVACQGMHQLVNISYKIIAKQIVKKCFK